MLGLLFAALCLGVTTALASGCALIYWDLSGATLNEGWRMQTGSTGCLTIWLAFMILYIDRLWQQRTSTAAHPGIRMHGDVFLGWTIVGVSLLLCATGVTTYLDNPAVGESKSIPLGVIRIGMSGLILAFGVCVLREGVRRRRAEESVDWGTMRSTSLAAAAAGSAPPTSHG